MKNLLYVQLSLMFMLLACNASGQNPEQECLKNSFVVFNKYYQPIDIRYETKTYEQNISPAEKMAIYREYKHTVKSLMEENFDNCPINLKAKWDALFEVHEEWFNIFDTALENGEAPPPQALINFGTQKGLLQKDMIEIFEESNILNEGFSPEEKNEIKIIIKKNAEAIQEAFN